MNSPGPKPQNNRRILSGILHVPKTECRRQDSPPEYDPYTSFQDVCVVAALVYWA
jgi:hypothetical protein